MEKLAIDGVYKIFGADPIGVLALVREGASKDQILEKTGHVIGIRDINLKIEEGRGGCILSSRRTLHTALANPPYCP